MPTGVEVERGADHLRRQSSEILPKRRFTLDLAHFGRRGYLVPGHLRSPLAQEVNAIKRVLIRFLEDRPEPMRHRPLVLVVTSTKGGEGKSFFSLNVALSFLFVDARPVLLVDADAVDGGLSRELGLLGRSGLGDELRSGEPSFDDHLLSAERHRLEVLPAGTLSSDNADWTRHDARRLVQALRRLAMDDTVVVIDTPPVSSLPVAHLLADYADHILFVVGAGQTRREEIALALAQLSGAEATSFVLNRALASPMHGEYGCHGSRA
jgi:receptor protein-tyrosine kinase